jgi:hypothetical protein
MTPEQHDQAVVALATMICDVTGYAHATSGAAEVTEGSNGSGTVKRASLPTDPRSDVRERP